MRTAVVGHRGVGKSSFLRRVQTYFEHESKPVTCLDLDREIERRTGRNVREIFEKDGESAFRWLEMETFRAIDEETKSLGHDLYLALGGGFDPSALPESWRCLWLRRVTDSNGRIFFDRPRLEAGMSALEEFETRRRAREPRFSDRADEVFWLDEGLDSADEAECAFVLGELRSIGGAITIRPSQFNREAQFEAWARARMNAGLRWFELRDDLLSPSQMERAIRYLPDDRVLVSYRDPQKADLTADFVERHALAFDWPIEYGPPIFGEPRFFSLHERAEGESIAEALARFPKEIPSGATLKAALPTYSFDELRAGDEWVRRFPEARLFLPMSTDGRWAWYRLLKGNSYDLNFVRDFEASAPDQPSFLQWARRARLPNDIEGFAAILGDPVSHSRTPMEQASFFAARNAPVLSIRIDEDEWSRGAPTFLRSLGLKWASVTSPLKRLAYEFAVIREKTAEELASVNTLLWTDNGWRGTNTDREGFAELVAKARDESGDLGRIAMWGGGGTLNVVKSVLPETELFSLRTGENRVAGRPQASEFSPETVIWGVGRSQSGEGRIPPTWKPRLVIDLNYADDSPGRDYAIEVGCRYISGLAMFRAQAEAQRRFWETSK